LGVKGGWADATEFEGVELVDRVSPGTMVVVVVDAASHDDVDDTSDDDEAHG
jgi:hypothetical protein